MESSRVVDKGIGRLSLKIVLCLAAVCVALFALSKFIDFRYMSEMFNLKNFGDVISRQALVINSLSGVSQVWDIFCLFMTTVVFEICLFLVSIYLFIKTTIKLRKRHQKRNWEKSAFSVLRSENILKTQSKLLC